MPATSPGDRQLSWPTGLAVACFFSFTLLFFSPAYLFFSNSYDFPFAFSAMFPVLLLLSLTLAAVVFFLTMSGKGRWREKGVALFFALGVMSWVQGNLLLWKYGPLDGRTIHWQDFTLPALIDVSLWVLVIVLALVFSKVLRRLARPTALMLLAAQLISVGIVGLRAPDMEGLDRTKLDIDASEKYRFSTKTNVIILVLDSFQTDAFQEIIHNQPGTRDIFKDFTHFRNNIGGYTGTYFAVPLILSGKYWDRSESVEAFARQAYLSESVPFVLKKMGYYAGIYPLSTPCLLYSRELASNFSARRTISKKEWAFVLDLALFRQAPHFLKKRIYHNQAWFLSRLFSETGSLVPGEKRVLLGKNKPFSVLNHDLEEMEALESTIRSGEQPVFMYWHWKGVHRPWWRNEKCGFEQRKYTRESYIGQAKCVLQLVGRFLDKLRSVGAYHNSLIFVIGDHGIRVERIGMFVEKEPGNWLVMKGDGLNGLLRQSATPLLLVKRIQATQPGMRISDAPTTMGDIARTVFVELGIANQAPGCSVFELPEGPARLRPFYVVSRQRSFNDFKLNKYVIDGPPWLPSSWHKNFSEAEFEPADD